MAELSVERLFSDPPLFGALPVSAEFTPDGTAVAYLRVADGDRESQDLWRYDIAAATHELWIEGASLEAAPAPMTAAEQAERERRRQFQRGITRFQFDPSGRWLLLPVGGAAWIVDLESATAERVTPRRVTPEGTRQTDFRFVPGRSASGQSVSGPSISGQFISGRGAISYVRDGNLFLCDLEDGHETALTHDGGGTVSNGIADFIAQEEMHRFDGHWWSPDGRHLAFTRVDEAPVAESMRYEIDADAIRVVPQRYPYAGARNAQVALWLLDTGTGTRREIPYRQADDDYLARVAWMGTRLAVQRQARDQQTLTLSLYDPVTAAEQPLLTETSPTWINLHDNFHPLPGDRFLWTSERDGASRLYLCQVPTVPADATRATTGSPARDASVAGHPIMNPAEGHPVANPAEGHPIANPAAGRALTANHGRVNRILWADAHQALVQGWFDTPTRQHLYRVDFAGGDPECVTPQPGWHDTAVSRDGTRILDRMTALDTPGHLDLQILDPTRIPDPARTGTIRIAEDRLDTNHPYHPYLDRHRTPVLGAFDSVDGQRLHYRLTRPAGPLPERGAPVIVYVYGGPGVHRVRDEWPPLLLQLLAQHGYGVLELDNRGTGNRDRGFEAPIFGRLGRVEVEDQLQGADWLAGQDWVDPQRIGVFGHSYGGYLTIMCLLQAGHRFRAGVAVAPVTDWRLYDTHYTERYLSTPAANPEGYRDSAVFAHLDGLRGPLLLIHGMADDNVLYSHSTRLYHALQARNLAFEMMAYPGAKHALQERDVSIHRFNLLLDFFGRHL